MTRYKGTLICAYDGEFIDTGIVRGASIYDVNSLNIIGNVGMNVESGVDASGEISALSPAHECTHMLVKRPRKG